MNQEASARTGIPPIRRNVLARENMPPLVPRYGRPKRYKKAARTKTTRMRDIGATGQGHSRGMLRATSVGGGPPPNPPPPGFLLGERPVASLEEYRALGGWRALEKARAMPPADVIAEIGASGLRGRGGAGFPTGTKWASVREGGGRHHYAVCNGAEGEPATFKDRALMRANPYQIIEGLLIAAHAVEAIEAYLTIKASFTRERDALTRALAEIGAEGLTDDIPVFLVTGPEEYLF